MTDLSVGVDDRPTVAGKTTTTVAMDFGRHHHRRRPDPLPVRHARARTGSGSCGTTSPGARSAPSVLVDTRRLADGFAAIDYFEDRRLPFVVAVNCFDGAPRYEPRRSREALASAPRRADGDVRRPLRRLGDPGADQAGRALARAGPRRALGPRGVAARVAGRVLGHQGVEVAGVVEPADDPAVGRRPPCARWSRCRSRRRRSGAEAPLASARIRPITPPWATTATSWSGWAAAMRVTPSFTRPARRGRLAPGDGVPALLLEHLERRSDGPRRRACGTRRPPSRRGTPRAGRPRPGARGRGGRPAAPRSRAVRRQGGDVDGGDVLAVEPVGDALGLAHGPPRRGPGRRARPPAGTARHGGGGADSPWRTSSISQAPGGRAKRGWR